MQHRANGQFEASVFHNLGAQQIGVSPDSFGSVQSGTDRGQMLVRAVPEPSTAALLALGLVAVSARRRK